MSGEKRGRERERERDRDRERGSRLEMDRDTTIERVGSSLVACKNQNNLGKSSRCPIRYRSFVRHLHMQTSLSQTHITFTGTTYNVPAAVSDSALRTFFNHSLNTGSVPLQI